LTLTLSVQFEKRVMRIMLGSIIKKAFRRLCKENPITLLRLLGTIRVRKLRRVKQVARMG